MKSVLKEFIQSLEGKGFLTGDIQEINEFTEQWENIIFRIFLENLEINHKYENRWKEDIPP